MTIGHNAVGHLRRIVDRVEAIDEEMKVLGKEKSAIYKAAKNTGLVPKAVKRVIAARRENPEKRAKEDMLFDTYFSSLEADEESPAIPEAGGEEGSPDDAPLPTPEPEPEPEPSPLHQPDEPERSFGSADLDGIDPPEQEEDDGKETPPKISMEFPAGVVPNEFNEKYD